MRRLSGRTPLGEPIALCLPVYFHREFKQAARLLSAVDAQNRTEPMTEHRNSRCAQTQYIYFHQINMFN